MHEGKTFNLYRATLGGREVALKTPAPSLTGEDLFMKTVSHGSEMIVSTGQGIDVSLDPLKIATWTLLVEAQIINLTAAAWNHEVIALGTWDGLSKCWSEEVWLHDEPLDLRFLAALVMPYHNAVAFSTLPHSLKRLLFPKMLPALWDALCKMPHGDLSESNLLINQTNNLFHIIDPGVVLSSSMQQYSGNTSISIFTTAPANYPVIPPFYGQPHDAPGLVSFIEKYLLHTGGEPLSSAERLPRPAACDLLALGIIYYRILTGKELFLGAIVLPEKPAWENTYVTPRFEDKRVYSQLVEALSGEYIQKELAKANLTPSEKRLAYALLNLEALDRDHLWRLSAG